MTVYRDWLTEKCFYSIFVDILVLSAFTITGKNVLKGRLPNVTEGHEPAAVCFRMESKLNSGLGDSSVSFHLQHARLEFCSILDV